MNVNISIYEGNQLWKQIQVTEADLNFDRPLGLGSSIPICSIKKGELGEYDTSWHDSYMQGNNPICWELGAPTSLWD